jgi:hypothetical protein
MHKASLAGIMSLDKWEKENGTWTPVLQATCLSGM